MENNINILLVEDNPGDARLARELLSENKSLQFEIIIKETLSDAILELADKHIDIILLDLGLPDSQGFETFNVMKHAADVIPIVILSGTDDEKLSIAAVKAGAQDYLVKGTYDGKLLSRVIRYAIERSKLDTSIKEYALIVENSEQAIISCNLNGKITTWNKGAEKIYGYADETALNKNISDLFPATGKSESEIILTNISNGLPIVNYETVNLREGGKEIVVSMTISPIIKNKHKPSGISILVSDITSLRLTEKFLAVEYRVTAILQESTDIQQSFNAVIETVCEILGWDAGEIWLIDESGSILKISELWSNNDLLAELKSYYTDSFLHPNEGLAGEIWHKNSIYWVNDISAEPTSQSIKMILNAGLKSALGCPITFHGKIFGVMLFYNTHIPKPTDALNAILSTISELLGAAINRNILEEQKTLLQSQLYIKNQELEHQMTLLKKASQAKSTFIANMSHELRTPLNTIIGFTELIYKNKSGPVSPTHHDYLEEVVKSAHHLLNLVNQILDISRIESGKLECRLTPTNIREDISSVCSAMRIAASEKKIQIFLNINEDVPNEIVTDSDKVKQIIINFVSNAIKFTPNGGKVTVSINNEDSEQVRISVTDTGIGISKDDIDKLFIEFGQLNLSYSKTQQGIGLGLALSKHLAELLGGCVGVTSEVGKGSTFYLILPSTSTADPNRSGLIQHSAKE